MIDVVDLTPDIPVLTPFLDFIGGKVSLFIVSVVTGAVAATIISMTVL